MTCFCVAALLVFGVAIAAHAHTPILNCFLNSDGTITCEGGFSDGSSGTGVAILVLDANENVLIEGILDEFGEFTFPKPQDSFVVVFDGGPGHQVKVKGEDIQ